MITFKQYLEEEMKKKKGSKYPARGLRRIVDFDKERTHKSYRSANSLSAPFSSAGGGRV